MKKIVFLIFLVNLSCNSQEKMRKKENYNKLTAREFQIIVNKGTEAPFTGKYNDFKEKGTFVCKQCDSQLYKSDDKFNSNCGWPSFDDEIEGTVKRIPDPDGRRTEIICSNCDGHLGHVFIGEQFTDKNTRHCVNSISLKFVPDKKSNIEKAIFAGGCFWGMEYHFENLEGVIETNVGYIGGKTKNPTYREVCSKNTEHVEALEVTFDNSKVTFEKLAKLFFEIHDPTQLNRQGPDIGEQYRSEIFYFSENQKTISQELIDILEEKGLNIKTKLTKATEFYNAEDYHQNYYTKKGSLPYCHAYTKRF